ncbi:MAG: 16S rRNA (uracil(1498)-N(3))-methyltransferase [Clostridiales bacterium]|nr:16S rRNA (uracil(1498)-N(3))-methyltransferase [Clostridiales bacterium]
MSGLRRFFVKELSVGELELIGEEFNHAANVLRLKTGERLLLCNNTGVEYPAEIVSVEKKKMRLMVGEGLPCPNEPKADITLCCGYLKGDKTELIVQKATELGVKNIIVFDSVFSSAYVSDNKMERLTRVAEESAKQCGRATYPTVTYLPFQNALEQANGYENKIFACEFESEKNFSLTEISGSTFIVVGSEGGFSEEEREYALTCGFQSVSLGNRILRAETACIALVSVVAYGLGEWKR